MEGEQHHGTPLELLQCYALDNIFEISTSTTLILAQMHLLKCG
jgi:hypothetical protein